MTSAAPPSFDAQLATIRSRAERALEVALQSDDAAAQRSAKAQLEELAPGVCRAEAEFAAAYAVRDGGFTTPEIEALRIVHDRERARTAEPFADSDLPGASVRDLTPGAVHLPDEPAPGPLPIDKIKRYHALHDEKVRLEAELGAVKKEKAELEQALVDAFGEAQTNSATVAGRPTFLRRQIVASKKSGVTTPELVKALRECGLDHLVTTDTVSASTLSGYVRDLDKADQELPPPLAAVVQPYEKYEIIIHSGRTK